MHSSASPIPLLFCTYLFPVQRRRLVIEVTPDDRVLTWGSGSSGSLGVGEMVNSLQPKLVKDMEGLSITHASAGANHSGFVSDAVLIFTCEMDHLASLGMQGG